MELKNGESLLFDGTVTCCAALKTGKSRMDVALEDGIIVIGELKVAIK